MTPDAAASAVAWPISDFGSRFMLDPSFYAEPAARGFEGIDFYVAGRGGVLGDVDADVVVAAFGFFEPTGVRAAWERARRVMTPTDSAALFVEGCTAWSRPRFTAEVDYAAVAALGGRIIDAASVTGLALFAAWRAVERPTDPKGAAALTLHVLREMRGGAHVIGETAAGLTPLETLLVKGGKGTARLFGWQPPFPDVDDKADAWDAGERTTNAIVTSAYAALDADELDQFVDLVTELHAGLSAAA
jgi:hypothetical protein